MEIGSGSGTEINQNHPIVKLYSTIDIFGEKVQKLEPGEGEIEDFLKEVNGKFFQAETELGNKLGGDQILAQQAASITGNDPRLTQIVGLYLVGDLFETEAGELSGKSLAEGSGLNSDNFFHYGFRIKEVCHDIIHLGVIFPEAKEASKFEQGLLNMVKDYEEKGLLHKDKSFIEGANT